MVETDRSDSKNKRKKEISLVGDMPELDYLLSRNNFQVVDWRPIILLFQKLKRFLAPKHRE